MAGLIYIADPMCSWCYGFGPELGALLEGLQELPLEIVVGGLRAYNREPADAEFKATIAGHWKEVAERSGLPFNDGGMARPDFVYDTEPACRAVVTARMLAPQMSLAVFSAIQHAFYAEGQDVTQGSVLASIAAAAMTEAGVPTEAADFLTTWNSEEAIRTTHGDFELTRRWGISGFPTLVLERDGKLDLVNSGFVAMPKLIELMQALVDQDEAPEAS